ncbi:putative acetolactate synthase [Podospora aff. communis PSN243]|uniref:Acetolactate synthase n=1 Tax=Podospora aff. communis PSN243 TaxID=3040156 RepID=A0AAV9G647_9PEZI|nr:putative acetolactate synthase [Podospora aff. communis PSN243]
MTPSLPSAQQSTAQFMLRVVPSRPRSQGRSRTASPSLSSHANMPAETVQIVIDSLLAAGVKYVFGVPGAKIDSVFNALIDHPEIKLVVCRHEQNAAFIAAAIGKLTGRPGVCIATSGPGTSNLVTGLITATDEGAPMVAIVGSVKRAHAAKRTHQSLRATDLLAPVTKRVVPAVVPDQIAEIFVDAFRVANAHPRGATAIVLPIDVITAGMKTSIPAFPANRFLPPEYGPSPTSLLAAAANAISSAKFPVLFLGARAADAPVVSAVHAFLRDHPLPVVETFQAAGAVSKELVHLFFGRIGLFRNQAGDKLLQHADLLISMGYDQAEYDANLLNPDNNFSIIHIDTSPADYAASYCPSIELVGSITENITALTTLLASKPVARPQETEIAQTILASFNCWHADPKAQPNPNGGPVHPLYFIRLLQSLLPPSTTVISDVGSVYIWLSRFFCSYQPHTFLVSNAQQTLGVALPWAMGACFSQEPPCSKKVISISGDGGFLFSGQELVTAVQQGCDITHFIWNDGSYNMVEFQEVNKYGRSSGVELGGVDFKKYAESMGAKGVTVSSSVELEAAMRDALTWKGVVVVDVTIDYSQNGELMAKVIPEEVS